MIRTVNFKNKLLNLIILVSFFSCDDMVRKKDIFSIVEEKIDIDFSAESLTPIISTFSIYTNEDKNFHLFIDQNNNLIISDLNSMNLKKVIPIFTGDGPDLVNTGLSFPVMIDSSNFFIESFPDFYILNERGYVKERVAANKLLREELEILTYENNNNFVLTGMGCYSNKTKTGEFIYSIKRMIPDIGEDYPLFPQFAKLSLDNKNGTIDIEILPIFFPKEFHSLEGSSYSMDESPKYTVSGDWLVYNYYFSSNGYFYNLNTGETKSMKLKISTGDNLSQPYIDNLPISRKINTGFTNILFDDNNKIIYRIHININKNNGMDNINYLSVFNFEGDNLLEYKIGSNQERMLRNAFIIDGKVYMNPFYPKSDEELRLITFKLESAN